MDAQDWIGPAIVAAFISGFVSLVLVQLNFRVERRAERLRRAEKVRDFQIALRAEIASDLLQMRQIDRTNQLQAVASAMAADPSYAPVLPRLSANPVFDTVVKDVAILPADVIAPVVHYERLRQSLEQFIEDLRSDQYNALSSERRLLAYTDYVATYDQLEALAEGAMQALDASFGLSRTAAAHARQASAGGGASAGSPSS